MQSSILALTLAFGICNAIDTSTIIEWNCDTWNQPSSTSPSTSSSPSFDTSFNTSLSISPSSSSSNSSSLSITIIPTVTPSNTTSASAAATSTVPEPCTPTHPPIGQSDFFGWQYGGCFADTPAGIVYGPATTSTRMTPDLCRMTCTSGDNAKRRFPFYGLEEGFTCTCSYNVDQSVEQPAICDRRCTGDQCQLCGGTFSVDVYYNREIADTAPTIPAQSADYNYRGCFDDTGEQKLLTGPSFPDPDTLTVDKCVSNCAAGGYPLVGVEAGQQCYCGETTSAVAPLVANRECNIQCSGAPDQFCGGGTGGDRLQLYEREPAA